MGDHGKKMNPEEGEVQANDAVRKPNGSKFHQQKLPAWQPLLTAGSVFPLFFIISFIFIPCGAYLYTVSEGLQELSINYTNCRDQNNLYCMELVSKPGYYGNYRSCFCNVTVNLKENITGQVYVYYGLTNFYQNHRRYVKSRDDSQLLGGQQSNLLQDCNPYRTEPNTGKWYAPCGAIANSLFNDSFQLFYHYPGGDLLEVPWTQHGIAWRSDRERKFGVVTSWNGTVKPVNWPMTAQQRSNTSYSGDEELMVWMRTAALPTFRKLHRIVQHGANGTHEVFNTGLPAGAYTLRIAYAYPVSAFSGTKSFILSTTSWAGGKNPAMGIMYMAVGCLHFLLGIVFTIVHLHSSKNMVASISTGAHSSAPLRTVSAAGLVMHDELGAATAAAEGGYQSSDGAVAGAVAGAGAGAGLNNARHTAETGIVDEHADADADAEGVSRRTSVAQQSPGKPRSMLQTLTLADY